MSGTRKTTKERAFHCRCMISGMRYYEELKNRLEKAEEIYKIFEECSETVVFGAGNTSSLYEPCIRQEKINPLFFCDNDHKKKGTFFCGKEVIGPADVMKRCENPIVLICSGNPESCIQIKKQCIDLKLRYGLLDEIVCFRHKKEILENYANLADDKSREVYRKILEARMDGLPVTEEIYCGNQYLCLPAFMKRSKEEIFVDCGAFVGDSIEQYIIRKACMFQKIYGFEPDPDNFAAMRERVERLKREWNLAENKIIPVQAGVGNTACRVSLENTNGNLSTSAKRVMMSKEGKIRMYALDDYFTKERVGFLKADIEGYEREMLDGAANVIKRDHPIIAVCIYHNATDMYMIMKMIKEIYDGYKFSVRHHSYEYCETVLYAW